MALEALDIDDYIDFAKEKQGLTSDNLLSQALGINRASISTWRKRKAWPSPDHMAHLAKLGGQDPDLAVLDLEIWRNEGPAKEIFISIAARLSAAAAVLAVVITVTAPNNAMAEQTRNNAPMVYPAYTLCDNRKKRRSAANDNEPQKIAA